MAADNPVGINSQFKATKEISATPLEPGVEGILVNIQRTYCRAKTVSIFKSIVENANNNAFAKR